MMFFFNSQPTEQAGRIAFGIPTVHFGKQRLQLGSAYPVFIREIRFGINGIFLIFHIPQMAVSHHHGIENLAIVELKVVLFQYRQALARTKRNRAGSAVHLAVKGFQKCRLSCAVCTDNPVAITRYKFHIHLAEQHPFAKLHT